jgi:hypothetical protein
MHNNGRTRGAAGGAALALFLSGAVGAGAQMPGGPLPPPVTINSCGPILDRNSQQQQRTIAGIPLSTPSSGIQIEFVNDASKTAELVNFAVDSNGQEFVIRDVGTFSPNVSIKHQYRNGAGQSFVLPAFFAPNVTCHVQSVKFTDGSVWRRGMMTQTTAPAPPSGGVLSVSPARVEIDSSADSELFLVSSPVIAAFRETDNCAGVAGVFVAATGQSTASYTVRPIASGSCAARIVDDAGNAVSVPIVVR